jgi:hypothetical protein
MSSLPQSVFSLLEFWLLVMTSLVLPIAIYATLMARRSISGATILAFAVALLALAGVDVFLLQSLAAIARLTKSEADDALLLTEISTALYLLPALFAGIGVNLASHVLIRHLTAAERRFEQDREGN